MQLFIPKVTGSIRKFVSFFQIKYYFQQIVPGPAVEVEATIDEITIFSLSFLFAGRGGYLEKIPDPQFDF